MSWMLFSYDSIFLTSTFTNNEKIVIKVLIQSPPSWIAWKKYQLYRATHERMWAMSTTSLSPNMGYVPLSLFLQFILLVLVERNSPHIAWHPLQQEGQIPFSFSLTVYSNQQTLRFISERGVLINRFLSSWTVWWDMRPKSHAVNSDIVGLMTLKSVSWPAGSSKHGCYGKSTSCASEETEILTLASLHMIPRLVIGSAGSSGPAFKVCQITGLSPAKIESV